MRSIFRRACKTNNKAMFSFPELESEDVSRFPLVLRVKLTFEPLNTISGWRFISQRVPLGHSHGDTVAVTNVSCAKDTSFQAIVHEPSGTFMNVPSGHIPMICFGFGEVYCAVLCNDDTPLEVDISIEWCNFDKDCRDRLLKSGVVRGRDFGNCTTKSGLLRFASPHGCCIPRTTLKTVSPGIYKPFEAAWSRQFVETLCHDTYCNS